MSLNPRLPFPALTFASLVLPALLLGTSVSCLAFTLGIAGDGTGDFGQGPRSIFVTGYGEVVFESGLDGALVVDPAYASTKRIELPTPTSGESVAKPSTEDGSAAADHGFVKITNRSPVLSHPMQVALQPVDPALENPPDGWNAVPEAASATLGLIGTLLLFLRRRAKVATLGKS